MSTTPAISRSLASELVSLPLLVATEIRHNQKQEADLIQKGSRKKEEITLSAAPKLAPPVKTENALEEMTQAFCAIFSSMAEGIDTGNTQLLQLQKLDQSTSQGVMDSCNIAIEKETQAISLEEDIQAQEDKVASLDKAIGWLSYLGIGMTVLSVLLSIPTAGASDALLAAEAAGDALGGAGACGAGAGAAPGAAAAAEEGAEAAADAGAQAAAQDGAEDAGGAQNACKCHECRYNNLSRWEKVCYNVGKFRRWATAGDTWRMKLYHKLFGLVGNVAACSPQFVEGLMKYKVSEKQYQLSDLQTQAAEPTALVQLNQMDFQFYGQLNQRQGDVCQNDGEQLSDVIQLAGGIMKGYNQIQANLVNPA